MARIPWVMIVTLLGAGALPGAAHGQRELLRGRAGPTLRIDGAKPIFDVGPLRSAHFLSTVWDVSLVVPVRHGLEPYARLATSVGELPGSGWSATVANPRVGALIGPRTGLRGEIHVDLPLSHEGGDGFATQVGIFTHWDQLERFEPNSWVVGGSSTVDAEPSPGTFFGARLAGTFVAPRVEGSDSDVYGSAAVFGDVPTGRARLWIEISTFALLTQPSLSFSRRTTFFGTVSLALPTDRFAPEAYLRIPLDEDISGVVNFIIGVRGHLGNIRPKPTPPRG